MQRAQTNQNSPARTRRSKFFSGLFIFNDNKIKLKSILLAFFFYCLGIAVPAFAQTRVETPVHSDKSVVLTLTAGKVWKKGEPQQIIIEIQNNSDKTLTISSRMTVELRDRGASAEDRKNERDMYWSPLSLSGDKGVKELAIQPFGILRKSFALDELKWGSAIASVWPYKSLYYTAPAGNYEVWTECRYDGAVLKSPIVLIAIKK